MANLVHGDRCFDAGERCFQISLAKYNIDEMANID